jgi:hypothetical protein
MAGVRKKFLWLSFNMEVAKRGSFSISFSKPRGYRAEKLPR